MPNRIKDLDNAIVIFLLAIAIGIGAIYFVGVAITSNENKAEEIKVNIQSEYLRRDRYKELLASYQVIVGEGIASKLATLLPTSDNFLDVVREIETIGLRSKNQLVMRLGDAKLTSDGIELDTSGGGQQQPPVRSGSGNFDFIEIEATLRGNNQALMNFLTLFYQSRYFMNIDSIVVNRIESGQNKYIDTQIKIRIFVQKLIRVQQRR